MFRAGGEVVQLVTHRCADATQQSPDLVCVPVVAADRLRHVDQSLRELVSRALVRRERDLGRHRFATREHGVRQQFGVAKGVGDPVGRDRVLEVAGIADQGPSGPVGTAHMPGQPSPAVHPATLAAVPHQIGHRRRERVEQAVESGLDAVASQGPHPRGRRGHEGACLPVVRRDEPGRRSGAVAPDVTRRGDARHVAVEDSAGRPAPAQVRRRDLACDHRTDAVGADGECCPDRRLSSGGSGHTDAEHTTVAGAQQTQHGRLVQHLGSRCGGRLDEHPVEQVAARRVQRVHARARAQRHLGGAAVAVVEGRAADRRRPCRDEVREHPPPRQLEDAGPHQRMGGDSVRAGLRPLEHRDPEAGPGQEEGGRGAGDPAPDDDHVIVVHEGSSTVSPECGAVAVGTVPVVRWCTTASAS